MTSILSSQESKTHSGNVRAASRGDPARELLQALPVAVYTTDAKGRITFYNQAAVKLAGREPKIGSDVWCLFSVLYWPDGRPMPHDESPIVVAVQQGRPVHGVEAVAERSDGTRISLLAYTAPLRDETEALTGAVNTLVDITERKHAERVSRRLESIVEGSHDAIMSMDLDGIITTWNHGAERLFGYTAEEAAGSPVTLLYPPDRADEAAGILGRIGRGEHIGHYETVCQRKDGSPVDISLTMSAVGNAEGRVIGASIIAQDITAQVQSRAALAESEERYRALFASAPIAIFVCDRNAVIQDYNHHAVELWGREPVCGVEQHCGSVKLWLPDGTLLPHAQSPIGEVLRSGIAASNVEVFIERRDGSRLLVLVNFAPMKNAKGEVTGAITSFVDITERRRAELRQQVLIDELNHRVKNTLATVQSIAAQLLNGTSDVELRETFDGRLVALSRTHDLLVRDSWEGASLRDLLLQEFEPYRSGEGTRFVVHGPDLGLNPKAALTLGMAFHELTTNAAKYGALSKPGGQVRVTWEILRVSAPAALRLKWMETGGPPVKKREHKGFGSTLIERGLSLELEGEVRVDFDPSGLICTMEIPLAAAGGNK